jgi:phosphatidylglycerol:prolipoprotein diacylglycerol transferase
MSFHGGLLGMIGATWLFARRRGLPILALGDIIACVAPIGLFLGRVANFVNGELYGRVADVEWAMVFPHGGPMARHPSQLYEAFLEGLVLFVLLAILARRAGLYRRPGLLTGVFLSGYGLARFLVEFVREPDAQFGFVLGPFSMGQILSIPVFLLGVYLMLRAWGAPKPEQAPNRGSAD